MNKFRACCWRFKKCLVATQLNRTNPKFHNLCKAPLLDFFSACSSEKYFGILTKGNELIQASGDEMVYNQCYILLLLLTLLFENQAAKQNQWSEVALVLLKPCHFCVCGNRMPCEKYNKIFKRIAACLFKKQNKSSSKFI